MEVNHPEEEEVPQSQIGYFYITARDKNKAVRVRKMLSKDAPGESGKAIFNTPIVPMARIQKNRMYAVTHTGEPVLVINLKTGAIEFTDTIPIYPNKGQRHDF